ncbi:MAG: hypothetical protein AB1671_09400 [Thermodesulfobacteriota bacterium]
MPTAVSDSSTLIHLTVLGRLGLLREFYDQVLIPPPYGRRNENSHLG